MKIGDKNLIHFLEFSKRWEYGEKLRKLHDWARWLEHTNDFSYQFSLINCIQLTFGEGLKKRRKFNSI